MSISNGQLIVLEGVDDVGKSTIANQLADRLRVANPTKVVAFPGHEPGSVGKWVYDLHHDPNRQSINPTCLQVLHIAAHIDCIESQIKPLINCGTNRILDRYWWSTYAYGVAGGVEVSRLEKMIDLEKAVWANYKPTCVALIRRRQAEEVANANLVREYQNLVLRERANCNAIEVWNEACVESAVSQIVDAVSQVA